MVRPEPEPEPEPGAHNPHQNPNQVVSSYAAAPISGRCLLASNSGAAPTVSATGQTCAVR